jgi:hypothetical protein
MPGAVLGSGVLALTVAVVGQTKWMMAEIGLPCRYGQEVAVFLAVSATCKTRGQLSRELPDKSANASS